MLNGAAAEVRSDRDGHRWRPHRVASALLRLVSLLVPLLASLGAGVLVGALIERPVDLTGAAAWWMALLAASTVALLVTDRLARRLLPLAALLRLCLLFPDRVPSRFRLAMRSGTTRSLQRRIDEARAAGTSDEPARAAESVLTLVAALAAHDRLTRGHSERVRGYTELLAEELHLDEGDRDRLRWASLLHDVGKVTVARGTLNKPGALDDDEWEELRAHTTEGARLVAPLQSYLGEWASVVEQHHERWDGSGYPSGLVAERIVPGARIVAVADTFDTMTSSRPYKRAVSATAARAELTRCSGGQFDPAVVRAFLTISLGKLRLAMGPFAFLAQLPLLANLERISARMATLGGPALPQGVIAGGVASLGLATLTLGGLATPTGGVGSPPVQVQAGAEVLGVTEGAPPVPGRENEEPGDDDAEVPGDEGTSATGGSSTGPRVDSSDTAPTTAGTQGAPASTPTSTTAPATAPTTRPATTSTPPTTTATLGLPAPSPAPPSSAGPTTTATRPPTPPTARPSSPPTARPSSPPSPATRPPTPPTSRPAPPPSAPATRPPATIAAPTTTRPPVTAAAAPTTTTTRPPTTATRPPTTATRPPVTTTRPPTTATRPASTTTTRPPTTTTRPASTTTTRPPVTAAAAPTTTRPASTTTTRPDDDDDCDHDEDGDDGNRGRGNC